MYIYMPPSSPRPPRPPLRRELRDVIETFTWRMLCTGNPFEVLSTRGDSVADVHRHHIKGGAAAPDKQHTRRDPELRRRTVLVWQMVSEAPDS